MFPTPLVLALYLAEHHYFFVHFLNVFSFLYIYTVEPPNKGQLGTGHFVPCSEVDLSLRSTNFFT